MAVAKTALTRINSGNQRLAWGFQATEIVGAGPRNRLDDTLSSLVQERLGTLVTNRIPVRLPAPSGASRDDLLDGARAAACDYLLFVSVFEHRNHIHMVGELIQAQVGFWSRVRRPIVGIRNHFYASQRIDAEFRALLDMSVRTGQRKFQLRPVAEVEPVSQLYAAATGDVDGDGFVELVRLTDKAIVVTRMVGQAGGTTLSRMPFQALPRAPVRSRDRFGSLVVTDLDFDGVDEVLFWMSDRKFGHVIRFDGSRWRQVRWPGAGSVCGKRRARGSPVLLCGPPLGVLFKSSTDRQLLLMGKVTPGQNHLEPVVSNWTFRSQGKHQGLSGLYWALDAMELKLPQAGKYLDLLAVVNREGQVKVRAGKSAWTIKGGGTALSMIDFDDDGVAELVRSGSAWPGERDELAIYKLDTRGKVRRLWNRPVTRVDALCRGDIDNDGINEVLVVSGRKLHSLSERR